MHRIAGLRILVVEDEALVAMDVNDLLLTTKCQIVGPYADVGRALKAISTRQIDCAILDIHLGNEHTIYLADALAERTIPFIWMSGHDPEILPARHRARPFVAKPFTAQELFDTLAHAAGLD